MFFITCQNVIHATEWVLFPMPPIQSESKSFKKPPLPDSGSSLPSEAKPYQEPPLSTDDLSSLKKRPSPQVT